MLMMLAVWALSPKVGPADAHEYFHKIKSHRFSPASVAKP